MTRWKFQVIWGGIKKYWSFLEFLRTSETPPPPLSICTYDTFITDDLTIDMISCQEQLEIEFQDWCINIRFENYGIYGIMLGMKGSKHIMLDKDLRMMTSQVQRLA